MRFFQAGVMLLGAAAFFLVPRLVGLIDSPDAGWLILAAFVLWNLLLVIATVLVIVDSVRKIRTRQTRVLATDVFTVKLAAIPFFLINFALLALVNLLGAAFWFKGGILLLAFVPLEIALTFVAMLCTSVYGWASIVQLRRDRVIGTGLTVLYSLMLLVFVIDIAAAILVFGHSRRRAGTALAVVLLVLGSALVAFGAAATHYLSIPGAEWFAVAGGAVILVTIIGTVIRAARLRRRVDAETTAGVEEKNP